MSNGGMGVSAADMLGIPSRKDTSKEKESIYDFRLWVSASGEINVDITIPQPPRKMLGRFFQPAALKPTLHLDQVLSENFGLISFSDPQDKTDLVASIIREVLDNDEMRAIYTGITNNSRPSPLVRGGSHLTVG